MSPGIRLVQSVNVLALAVWLAALLAGGVSAAITFSTLKPLPVTLAGYTVPAEDQWSLIGGMIANRVFVLADIVQFACALLAGVTLAVLVISRSGGAAAWSGMHLSARLVGLSACLTVFGYHLLVLSQRLAVNLNAYWTAAKAGDSAKAAASKALFDADHPQASAVLSTLAALVLCSLVLAAWPPRGVGKV